MLRLSLRLMLHLMDRPHEYHDGTLGNEHYE